LAQGLPGGDIFPRVILSKNSFGVGSKMALVY